MNESRQIWMKLKLYISPYGSSLSFVSSLSHIKSEWAVSHIPYASNKVIYPTLAQGYAAYESCRIRVMPHILHPICISHIPHPIWMSHVKHEWSQSNISPYDSFLMIQVPDPICISHIPHSTRTGHFPLDSTSVCSTIPNSMNVFYFQISPLAQPSLSLFLLLLSSSLSQRIDSLGAHDLPKK